MQAKYYRSAEDLLDDLKNKKVTSYELTQQAIDRIKSCNAALNAIVVHDFEAALVQAKQADRLIQQGEWQPLLGLPMTVKESFGTKAFPTTWGNPSFKDYYPAQDGVAVDRLKKAGAIILGKSNVPFMLKDWQTNNPIYGLTVNPYDSQRSAGGSSGGSAVALAAGMVSLELGSDLAGSLRVPAHFCGVYSHKSSSHLIPLRGSGMPKTPQVPGRKLTYPVSGPMARSANDLRIMLDVLAGPDPLWDGRGYQLNLPKPDKQLIRDYRVLVINEHPLCPLSHAVKESLETRVEALRMQGVSVSYYTDSMPALSDITRTYLMLFSSFGSVGLSDDAYKNLQMSVNSMDHSDSSIQFCLMKGRVLTQREYLQLEQASERLRASFIQLFDDYDLILSPVMPTPAFLHDDSDISTRKLDIDGDLVPYVSQYAFVSIPTCFGLPATVVPISQGQSDLPIGMQVIGHYLDDYKTIHFAHLMETHFGGFVAPPGYE